MNVLGGCEPTTRSNHDHGLCDLDSTKVRDYANERLAWDGREPLIRAVLHSEKMGAATARNGFVPTKPLFLVSLRWHQSTGAWSTSKSTSYADSPATDHIAGFHQKGSCLCFELRDAA